MVVTVDRTRLLARVEELMLAHAPSGQEAEVDDLVQRLFSVAGRTVQRDRSGALVLHLPGRGLAPAIAVAAHKDEIALIVKRVEKDGRLKVQPTGGLHPWAVGETPVEVLTHSGPLPGVLSIGAKHVSRESPAGVIKEGSGLTWEQMWVETHLDEAALCQAGVRVGQRVVLARPRKQAWYLGQGQFVCGYNLDCRGGLAILAEVAHALTEHPPAGDVYLVATAEEEVGAHGALYSVAQLPVDTLVAVDVAPVAEEYQTRNSAEPVLLCKDSSGLYHQGTIDRLVAVAGDLGFGVQLAVVTSYGSDASIAHGHGHVARAALVGYPGGNTHGFEICHIDGLANTARLLIGYLLDPGV